MSPISNRENYRLLYLTETLAVSESMVEKISRSGNYWYVKIRDEYTMLEIWDTKRGNLKDLFEPKEER